MTITKHDVKKCIQYFKDQQGTYEASYGKNNPKAQAYRDAAEYLEYALLPRAETNKRLRS